jgi:hypothetical protein
MQLVELPSTQLTLAEWLRLHPDSKVLQPDTLYKKRYASLVDYDNGKIEGSLEHRDSLSWRPKSWVVGVRSGSSTKAYDWNDLVTHTLIQDTVGATPVLLLLGGDSATYHVWNRKLSGQILSFGKVAGQPLLIDNTGSQWDLTGLCISGKLKDQQLQTVQAYQEFWHSWSHFHPSTTMYKL